MTGIPVPANPPDVATLHTCSFNRDWLAVILGAMTDLYDASAWESPPSDILEQIDQLYTQVMTDVIISPQFYPEQSLNLHGDSLVTVGNPLAWSSVSTSPMNGYWLQATAAQNDAFNFNVFLRSGLYTFRAYSLKHPQAGKASIYFNSGVGPVIDLYAATAVAFNIEIADVGFLDDGQQNVEIRMTTKNSSSTGYRAYIAAFSFTRTGDI